MFKVCTNFAISFNILNISWNSERLEITLVKPHLYLITTFIEFVIK